MPGYHYVLNYDRYGNYQGRSIAPDSAPSTQSATIIPTASVVSGVSRPIPTSSSAPVQPTQNFTWQVGQNVNQIIGTGTLSGTLPPGIVHTSSGTFTGIPTTPGFYSVTLTWSDGNYYQANMTVTGTAITTTPSTSAVTLMNWLSARAAVRSGKKIRRNIWSDRFLTFENFLFWVQFFDATTKVLGTKRVVQAADFGMAEFQALDWTTDGIADQNSAAASVGWSYAPATSDHLLTDTGDTILSDSSIPITQ